MDKIKRIGFISLGFAFNRLNRMRYYEKAFPKDTKIYLLTSSSGKKTLESWNLKRTKIITFKIGFKSIASLRKICKKHKLDRIVNLGSRFTGLVYPLVTFGIKTDFILAVNGSMPTFKSLLRDRKVKDIYRLLITPFLTFTGKKVIFVDFETHKRFKKLMKKFNSDEKIAFLPAPIDSKKFLPRDKTRSRKKLKLPMEKEIVLFVGRVNYGKGADIVGEVARKNPNKLFVIIGKTTDGTFEKYKPLRNIIHYEKKFPEELVDYYNAADLGFFLQRTVAGGLGLTAQESLACGTPAIVRKKEGIIEPSIALIETSINVDEADKNLKRYFSLSKKRKKEISKAARDLILKHYSGKKLAMNYARNYLGE